MSTILTRDELRIVLDLAAGMADRRGVADAIRPLTGRTVATLFAEPSTRTRVSFELAVRALGGDPVSLDASSSSLAKGESLIDTVRTLEALGAGMLVVRHPRSGAPQLASEHFSGPGAQRRRRLACPSDPGIARPVHAAPGAGRRAAGHGQGVHRGRRAPLSRRTVEYLGAHLLGHRCLAHRARRCSCAASRPGRGRFPRDAGLTVTGDLAAGISGAAAVMALRVQRERLEGAGAPSEAAYAARWGLTEERLVATCARRRS